MVFRQGEIAKREKKFLIEPKDTAFNRKSNNSRKTVRMNRKHQKFNPI